MARESARYARAEIPIVHKLFVKGHCVSIKQKDAVRAAVLTALLRRDTGGAQPNAKASKPALEVQRAEADPVTGNRHNEDGHDVEEHTV